MIIIVFGLPGSGKSFFASRLASKLSAKYINSDELRRELFTVRTYTEEEKMVVYDVMLAKMNSAQEHQITLVIDGTFYKESIRKKFRDDADKNDLWFIEVTASESVIRSRLNKPRNISEADFAVYKKIKEQWEPMKEEHLIIKSTNNNIVEMLRKAEDYLLLYHDKK